MSSDFSTAAPEAILQQSDVVEILKEKYFPPNPTIKYEDKQRHCQTRKISFKVMPKNLPQEVTGTCDPPKQVSKPRIEKTGGPRAGLQLGGQEKESPRVPQTEKVTGPDGAGGLRAAGSTPPRGKSSCCV